MTATREAMILTKNMTNIQDLMGMDNILKVILEII